MIAAAQKAADTFTVYWIFSRDDVLCHTTYTKKEAQDWIATEGEYRLYDVVRVVSKNGERTVDHRPALTLKGPKR